MRSEDLFSITDEKGNVIFNNLILEDAIDKLVLFEQNNMKGYSIVSETVFSKKNEYRFSHLNFF